jgi:DNA-binding IclR family transcriptional regulator
VARYWQQNRDSIVPLTPSTITDEKVMLDELAEIRKQGYALDREENGLGMWCIAAPIFNIRQQVEYAVSVAVSTAGLRVCEDFREMLLV